MKLLNRIMNKGSRHLPYVPYESSSGIFEVLNNIDSLKKDDLTLISEDFEKLFSHMTASEITRFFIEVRQKYYHQQMRISFDKLANIAEAHPYIVMIGMFCHDGYIREYCTQLMSSHPDFLHITMERLNDWVPQVRKAAEETVLSTLKKAGFTDLIRVFGKINEISRGRRYDTRILSSIFDNACEQLDRAAHDTDISVVCGFVSKVKEKERRYIYREVLRKKLIGKDICRMLLSAEDKRMMPFLTCLIADCGYAEHDELLALTQAKHPAIRATAARILTRDGLFEGSEKLLIDESKAVRNVIQYAISKHSDLDARAYCKEHFPLVGAIKGFGETGTYNDEKDVLDLIHSENPKISAAAVTALFNLTWDRNDHLYYGLISDKKKSVSKAAFKAFMGCGGSADPERVFKDIISNEDDPILQKKYTRILCRRSQGLWYSMPWIIRLCDYNRNETVSEMARRTFDAHSCYFSAGNDTAEKILEALSEGHLTKKAEKQITDILNRR